MSVNSHTIRLIIAADGGYPELLAVAEAMERGPDASRIYSMTDDLENAGAPDAAIGVAIIALAEKINETNEKHRVWISEPDEHTGAKDSNRSRRGMPDKEWRELRQRIFERDGFACTYCDDENDLTCDHIIPLVRGGSNDESNLATACRSCNASKGPRTLEEWRPCH